MRGGKKERSQRRTREVGSFAGLIVKLIVSCNSSFPNISTRKLINSHAFMCLVVMHLCDLLFIFALFMVAIRSLFIVFSVWFFFLICLECNWTWICGDDVWWGYTLHFYHLLHPLFLISLATHLRYSVVAYEATK